MSEPNSNVSRISKPAVHQGRLYFFGQKEGFMKHCNSLEPIAPFIPRWNTICRSWIVRHNRISKKQYFGFLEKAGIPLLSCLFAELPEAARNYRGQLQTNQDQPWTYQGQPRQINQASCGGIYENKF